ncbi:hypothetical protein BC940DRAFT_312802 [Gongronella butleri]|nr:hypothetical protein BC940DRAFT_312802 [Gongronella butleri]
MYNCVCCPFFCVVCVQFVVFLVTQVSGRLISDAIPRFFVLPPCGARLFFPSPSLLTVFFATNITGQLARGKFHRDGSMALRLRFLPWRFFPKNDKI